MVTQKMKFQWRKRLFQKKETKDSKEKQNHEEIKHPKEKLCEPRYTIRITLVDNNIRNPVTSR